MSIPKYIQLLHQKLRGTLSEASANELDQWRQADAENEALARQTEKAWEMGARYKSGYQPDVQAGFAQLKAKMQAAETKVVPLKPRRNWMAIAASIALVVGCIAIWQVYNNTSPAAIVAISTKPGEHREVKLPDGSTLMLNENSRIAYAPDMHQNPVRRITLSGEAYFDVVKDPSHPFIIVTDYATVQVLGTAFNVRAYRHELQTEVEVERGKVSLQGKTSDEALMLGAGQRGICRPDGSLAQKKAPELQAHSWRTGKLSFRGTSLDRVVEALERHYKVRIRLAGNTNISACPFSGNFDHASIDEIMETIAVTLNAGTTRLASGEYQISGGNCK